MSRLRLEDVGTTHLQTLSLELQDGECIGLSGPSGMGKSLLLRAIADLDPHQGRIWLDGQEQQAIPPTEWRSRVVLLEAESAWWAEKVGDHFTSIDSGALQQLGFAGDCLNWSTEHLSSGEKQRLALLRVLAMQPEVLLLDEPTANLDADSAKKVESLIDDYRQQYGASVIWVSHDPEQIKRVTSRHYRLAKDGLFEVTGK
jgi:ABC-type iron transport system FetAB ATPase subunit